MANHPFELFPEQVSNEEFLVRCLKDEIPYREQRAKGRHIRQAQIPAIKTFEAFDTGFQKGITHWQLRQLAALNWIDGILNVIFIGPSGTGKTHLALAIAGKACGPSGNHFRRLKSMIIQEILLSKSRGFT